MYILLSSHTLEASVSQVLISVSSGTQGPCCNATTCGMIPEAANLTCADENECSYRVSCKYPFQIGLACIP